MARRRVALARGTRVALCSAVLLTLFGLVVHPTAARSLPSAATSARSSGGPVGAVRALRHVAAGPDTTWRQQAAFGDPTGQIRVAFGQAVALSVNPHGSAAALIGTPGVNTRTGAVYIYGHNGRSWRQQQLLVASDDGPHHNFGWSIAVSGDTALIGAVGSTGQIAGAAYVFTRSGATWTQQAKLTASDGTTTDGFGGAVAVSGDTALVGAPNVLAHASGAVYVFTRSGATWTQQAKLTASDGTTDDAFGWSVALNESLHGSATALIGAPQYGVPSTGAAYVFTRSGATWTQQAELSASDGAASDSFGFSAAVGGNTALVGAEGAHSNTGAAYVFTRSGATWTQQAELSASDAAANDEFGGAVALNGSAALVGAPGLYGSGLRGQSYIFVRGGATWTQQATLIGSLSQRGDFYGWSVALDGPTALVGSPGENSLDGAAYVFARTP